HPDLPPFPTRRSSDLQTPQRELAKRDGGEHLGHRVPPPARPPAALVSDQRRAGGHGGGSPAVALERARDAAGRPGTRVQGLELRSEEHTSELQSRFDL